MATAPLDNKLGKGEWLGEDILSIEQFGVASAKHVLRIAEEMKAMVKSQGSNDLLKGKLQANVFFEPSTRTTSSFQSAMLRLGGMVVPVKEDTSSATKGETLFDTIKCLESYADVIVLRHPEAGAAKIAAAATSKPVVNAGDGVGEHPSQALLDLYTITNELGTMDLKGKVITMVGDLKNGRTVHSLSQLLALFGCEFNYVAPESLKMPREIYESVKARGAEQHEMTNLDAVINETDVLYVTRVQKERFESKAAYDAVKDSFIIKLSTIANAKKTMAIMHPLPRVGEILEEVDADPRAAYFRQMENGMYVRMALMALVLGKA